jgi:hypothetical protein
MYRVGRIPRYVRIGSISTELRCPRYVRSPLNFRHYVAASRTSKWAINGHDVNGHDVTCWNEVFVLLYCL